MKLAPRQLQLYYKTVSYTSRWNVELPCNSRKPRYSMHKPRKQRNYCYGLYPLNIENISCIPPHTHNLCKKLPNSSLLSLYFLFCRIYKKLILSLKADFCTSVKYNSVAIYFIISFSNNYSFRDFFNTYRHNYLYNL